MYRFLVAETSQGPLSDVPLPITLSLGEAPIELILVKKMMILILLRVVTK